MMVIAESIAGCCQDEGHLQLSGSWSSGRPGVLIWRSTLADSGFGTLKCRLSACSISIDSFFAATLWPLQQIWRIYGLEDITPE